MEIVNRSLQYSLIYKGEEYFLKPEGRETKITNEGKENLKTSLNGTIHQAFFRGNLKFTFKWDLIDFDDCLTFENLFNEYNTYEEPLFLRRQKVQGEFQLVQVILSLPSIQLIEIVSTGEKWGKLELEVTSKEWLNLSF